MPRAPKICCEPKCPRICTPGQSRCALHKLKQPYKRTNPQRSSSTDHKARRARVLERDGYQCQIRYVGICTGTATHMDHIVPLSKGGADTDANSQSACAPCHKRKTSVEGNAAQGHRVRELPRAPAPLGPPSTPPAVPRRINMFRPDDDHQNQDPGWPIR